MSNNALLIMVHGSPRPASNASMFAVVEEVRARGVFARVEVGFMECNEPTIPSAIEVLAQSGATKIVAVPYFLHAGTHVAEDLPTLLEAAQEKYPEIEFAMGDFLGHDDRVSEVLRERVLEC